LLAGTEDPLDLPLRFELPMLLLGALALGDVAADRLILVDGAAVIEESARGPVLPAYAAVGSQHLVLARRHWPIGGDRAQVVADGLVALDRKELPEAPADQVLRRPAKGPAHRAVDEGVRAIGKKAADQLRLILDDGPVLRLATAQGSSRPLLLS